MRLMLALVLVCVAADVWAADTTLFNGQDFSGWKQFLPPAKDGTQPDPKITWSVKEGVIICQGKPAGYLVTDKEYENYTLRLKWRFPADSKGGNSGVLLHITGDDRVWPNSVEAQLAAGQAGDFWLIANKAGVLPKLEIDTARQDPKQARHYFRIGRGEKIEKPFGEWNEYLIECRGSDITLSINGQKVNEGRHGELTKGRIGLQSEGAEIHFKDIVISTK